MRLAYELAERLGIANVNRMLRDMPSLEWRRWKAYMQLTPTLDETMPWIGALIALATWNVEISKAQGAWDSSKKRKGARPEPRNLHEFVLRFGDMPDPRPAERKLTPQEQFDRLRDLFEANGMQPVKR